MPSLFDRFDGGANWSFGLTVDGITIEAIQEVDGLKLEVDEIEVKQNTIDGKYVVKKVPGRRKVGELTFTRAFTGDDNWMKWIEQVWKGDIKAARKHGDVTVYNYDTTKHMKWTFKNAWPKSVEISGLKAGDASATTEKMTLVYEELEPEA